MKKLLQQDDKNDDDDGGGGGGGGGGWVVVVVVMMMMMMMMMIKRLLGNFRFLFSENLHFKSKGKRDFSRLRYWVSTAVCLNLPKKTFDRLSRPLT